MIRRSRVELYLNLSKFYTSGQGKSWARLLNRALAAVQESILAEPLISAEECEPLVGE